MKKAKKVNKKQPTAKAKKKVKVKTKAKAKPAAKKAAKKAVKPAKKKVVAKKPVKARPVVQKKNNSKGKTDRGTFNAKGRRKLNHKRIIDMPVPMASKPAPVPVRKEDTDKLLYL